MLPLLLAVLACREPASERTAPLRARAAATPVSLAPRPAGTFDCGATGGSAGLGSCIQLHPRLPDTGEWLCAELDGVVWCSGGDEAAGVVSGPADPSYRCGQRGGSASSQRVCIDRRPDYPTPSESYRCRFEQERGLARVCQPSRSPRAEALPEQAVPACFLDTDCPSRRCDRGACRCTTTDDCERGSCRQGTCVEVER